MTAKRYLTAFFTEKNLPYESWEIIADDGTPHYIDSDVVIEHILIAPKREQEKIASILQAIDYRNGDVNHFLRHLAQALVANY